MVACLSSGQNVALRITAAVCYNGGHGSAGILSLVVRRWLVAACLGCVGTHRQYF